MARRKVILPNWSANEADSKSIEMLGAEFSGLTQGELVINTNVDNTLLSTLNEDGKVVVFESSEMIDKRLEGFLDKVHQHDNYDVLSAITSGMVESWSKAEVNAIAVASAYTDKQIEVLLSGATEAFDTLKEVEEWISSHSGGANTMIENINDLFESAHTHDNYDVLSAITSGMVDTWNSSEENAITSAKSYTDGILTGYTTKKYVDDAVANVASVPGEAATITGVTAQYIESATTPVVTVNPTGTENERGFEFSFGGLMGPRGLSGTSAYIEGATASIDSTTGVPQVIVTSGGNHSNISFNFAFSGLKGDSGEDGIGIKSFVKTSGDGSEGSTDEYTVTFTNEVTSAITVYNGKDGDNGITPEFTSITATVNNTTGTPNVFVSSSKTEGEKYSLVFNFDNLKGEKGEDGTSVKILGTKNSNDELPSSNNINGDGYIIGENLWVWNGSIWQDVGKVKGPKGDSGVGISTITKISGTGQPGGTDTYKITLTDNSTYTFDVYNGKDGVSGVGISAITKISGNSQPGGTDTYAIKLTNGNSANTFTIYNGSDGADGSKWHYGEQLVPTPLLGENGDWYLNTSQWEVYCKENGNWERKGNIKGANGANGSKWYSSITDPDPLLGENGDCHLNTYTWDVFCKENNIWVKKGSIKGDTGTFDSTELNNYVRTDNVDYTTAVNKTHSHSNKIVLDDITSAKVTSWDNAESNAVATASAYTDSQIKLVVSGATNAFDTLKEVETWINNHSGQAGTMITSINAISGVAHSHSNYEVLTGITADKIAPSFRYVSLGAMLIDNEVQEVILSASTTIADSSEKLTLFSGRGISISGNPKYNVVTLTGPVMSMYDYTSGIKYSNEDTELGNFNIHVKDNFLSVSGHSVNHDTKSCTTWYLNVNTGTTIDTLAVGNHTHSGTYLEIGTYNTDKEDIYSTITASEGVTLTSVTGKTYLIGCSSKTGGFIRGLNTSETDIYMEGGEVYAASDERLKNFGDNIDVNFEKLLSIPKVYYTWKNDESKNNMIGTSAQKLKEIYPELVSESEDGKMAVSYEKLSIIALAAVDKLHKENEELKDRLKRIEEKLGL